MAVRKGDKAPDFTLSNTNNKKVCLSDFQGKKNVLVLFFPLAFTGVCTKELCRTRDHLSRYEDLDAEVIAISVDSPFTLKEFKKANGLNFLLLSDFNKNISKTYGALYDKFHDMLGVSKRAAFVIDKQGTTQYAEVLEDAGELPDFGKIETTLDNLSD